MLALLLGGLGGAEPELAQDAAQDHPHPTFSADGTRFQIQSAMLSSDNRSMNICIVPVPQAWLNRTYSDKLPE